MSSCPPDPFDVDFCARIPEIYLRPDQGMSVVPWLLIVIILLIHLPVVFLRVFRWESVQILSLGMATFVVTLTCIAYGSTKLAPKYILVWAPIGLALDVGAMLQVFVLVLEKPDDAMKVKNSILLWLGKFQRWDSNRSDDVYEPRQSNGRLVVSSDATVRLAARRSSTNDTLHGRHPEELHSQPSSHELDGSASYIGATRRRRTVGAMIVLLSLSGLLCLILIALQMVGLAKAVEGYPQGTGLMLRYCSPGLQTATVLCDIGNVGYNASDIDNYSYTVFEADSKGLGCIDVRGDQSDWLYATKIVLSVELVMEMLDAALLIFVNTARTFGGVKLKRPFFTMLIGIGAWATLVGIGVYQSQTVPISARVALAGLQPNGTCRVDVFAGGLRGTLIGWGDGLFINSTVYWGPIVDTAPF